MNKSIITIAVTALISSSILMGCNTPSEKLEDAQNNFVKATNDLDKAKAEELEDIEAYKKEVAEKTATNEKSIAEYKARIENEKQEAKDVYNLKIAKLEQKNSDLRKKMDEYQAQGKEQWASFKTELSHDMNELGKAFKEFGVKSDK